ncbi:MAG: hypothetical protein LAN62_06905 [Acidobacteriia bacterium]|nr:hypothetical protein [Terriglobia bacterium]
MKRRYQLIAVGVLWAVLVTLGPAMPGAQDQTQQQNQPQSEKEQKEKKKKGGFFSGLKAVTGQSSEQQEDTATAGTKGVGEGVQIGKTTPSAADRRAVSAMESYSIPQPDLKKFQEDGALKPAK